MPRYKRPTFSSGIGNNARDEWSGGKPTPNQFQQLPGFYVGQVMDDQDDQKMGRVWVYIPAVSGKRFDPDALPAYGGTSPDRIDSAGLNFDQKLRAGWLLVSPMLPFFGADDFRSAASPDGRNSLQGDVNSYGMWYQPRIGDFVGVMFDGGNASSGYWIGMVPKQYRNGMVPGTPGQSASNISNRDKSGVPGAVSSNSSLPTMDKAPTSEDPTFADRLAASDLARSIAQSGTAGDTVRGAGTSGARRESPSYVIGLKSPGWTYDSEKFNRDADGTQFQNRVKKLSRVNSTGHSLVMDDHPDHQSIRLRSSSGTQLLFHDAGQAAVIYMQTAKGNVWIELCDHGNVAIYAGGSISMHAESDFNLTVDGNMNVQVNGDMNTLVGGTRRETVAGDTVILHQGEEQRANVGEYDHTISSAARFNYEGDLDQIIAGNQTISVGGYVDTTAGGTIRTEAGGSYSVRSGGTISLDGSAAYVNSGMAQSPAGQADIAALPLFPKIGKAPGSPSGDQILGKGSPEAQEYLAPIVPQHQPWALRCGVGATPGTNGYVRARPVPGAPPPSSQNKNCNQGDISQNRRAGASRPEASSPDPVVGGRPSSVGEEACATTYAGVPYQSDSAAEEPEYKAVRMTAPEEVNEPGSLAISDDGLKFIREQETFSETPTLDASGEGYVIGYGHKLAVGDMIGGEMITEETLQTISANGNDFEKNIRISKAEAENFLSTEIEETQNYMREQFPNNEFTQEQFDATASFIRNTTPEVLESTPEGQEYLEALRNNDYAKAQELMTQFSHVGSGVDCDVLDRRRAEVGKFGAMPDRDGITFQNIDYVPDGQTVELPGGFKASGEVYNAIANAQATASAAGLPDGYMWAMAAQESGFNPKAQASTSSAAGLYQFITSTGTQYGLSEDRGAGSNVYDPQANANAAVQFAINNAEGLKTVLDRQPNATDLYMAHFLGLGGARKFFSQSSSNPNGTPATEGFASQAAANKAIFYRPDGTPKTYGEIYGGFSKKISCRAQKFSSLGQTA